MYKKKLVGFFICIFLIVSVLPIGAQNITNIKQIKYSDVNKNNNAYYGHISISEEAEQPEYCTYLSITVRVNTNVFNNVQIKNFERQHIGFQVVDKVSVGTRFASGPISWVETNWEIEYDWINKQTKLKIDMDIDLSRYETLIIFYNIVPILFPDFETYKLKQSVVSYMYQGILEYDVGEISNIDISGALGHADYLIVTNPSLLFLFDAEADVNKLLCRMAELAALKWGVLGYLYMPSAVYGGYTTKDAFTCGKTYSASGPDVFLVAGENKNTIDFYKGNGNYLGNIDRISTYYGRMSCGNIIAQDPLNDRDEILIGDIDHNRIAMYSSTEEIVWGDVKGIPIAGNVDDDSLDEIILWYWEKPEIQLFNIATHRPEKVIIEDANIDEHDYVVMGDLDADGKDEIIISHWNLGIINIYDALGNSLGEFQIKHPYIGWQIACGNVDNRYDGDEIIVPVFHWLDEITQYNEITIFSYNTILKKETELGSFDGGFHANFKAEQWTILPTIYLEAQSSIACGDVFGGDGVDEILVATQSDNMVNIFNWELCTRSEGRYLLNKLTTKDGEWAKKLGKSYTDWEWYLGGYFLIVGETNIIPSGNAAYNGDMNWLNGRETIRVTDSAYANTEGSMADPELKMGRIIGNTAAKLIKPIQWSVDEVWGEDVYGNDVNPFVMDNVLLYSGFNKGVSGKGDYIFMAYEIWNHILPHLKDKGIEWFWIHCGDGKIVRKPKPNINDESNPDVILDHSFDNNVIHLHGHGDWNNLDVFNINNININYINHHPLVVLSGCAAGKFYTDEGPCLAEIFLQKGAAVVIASTENTFATGNGWFINNLYSRLDKSISIGEALLKAKVDTDWSYTEYHAAAYHLFGDPKYNWS